MNSIYKVIWSKAKNCYVVASEIAKSHTKSASGQSVRRSALASLLALSFLCGGLGVASAALEVVNQSGTPGAVAIYTKDEVDLALAAKGAATDVATNKANINAHETAINDLKAGDTALNQKIEAEQDARVEFDQALKEKIETEMQDRAEVDQALKEKIEAEMQDRAEVDQALKEKIEANTTAIGGLTTKDSELEGKIQANKDAIDATNKRTDGIKYDDVRDETTIENNVTVDSIGNVTAKGQLTAQGGVNAGNSDIRTEGEVNAGSLNVENASHLKGDVTMDKKLSVTGDTSLKGTKVDGKLAVTDDADLKNTKVDGTLITTGKATFQEAVEMDKGLTVTGDTKLKATTVDGKLIAGDADLKNTTVGGKLGVTGETTLSGELKAEKDATFEKNVTVGKDLTVDGKLNVGEIYLEHKKLESTGKDYDSATSITADGISNRAKVTDENGNTTESKFTHNEKGTFNYAKDEKITGDKNTHTYSQTAAETKEQLVNGDKSNFEKKTAEGNTISIKDKDAAGNDKSLTNKQTVDGEKTSVTNKESSSTINQGADQIRHNVTSADGKKSSIEVKADGITNTSKDGTITNDAKDIVNNATGNMTNTVGGNQTNTIDGNQENTIGGNQTTNVTGDISNKAENITNEATDTLTDKVGDNTRVITSRSITDTVGRANRVIEDGKITDNAGDFTVTTDEENGTTFANAGSTASSFTTVDGTPTGRAQRVTNVKGNEISTGKVEANYVKMDYADVMHNLGVHGNATVDNDLTVKGTTTTKTLNVTENATVGGTLDVTQRATFHDAVDIAKDLSVGGDVTANSYKVGRNTYIDANGINANNQKITNVADGSISEGSKDAVNGGQLYGVKRDLEHQVDKVGANAAAMANLRPMEFDPSSKWNIAAAIGNYGSETAAALGAFYRPNDNVMVNLSTAFGTGENMVGGGVSVRLGKGGNKLSREETNALKAQVADLTARMDALLSVLNPNMSKDFPDVPENHWAYEAVSRLAGNDIVQGYPDGEFHGERTMTRYEMAEIIYNALSRGAEAERELVEEFKPELQAMAASEKATAEKAEG